MLDSVANILLIILLTVIVFFISSVLIVVALQFIDEIFPWLKVWIVYRWDCIVHPIKDEDQEED